MHWKITALWGGKKVELRETQRAVTPFGGLVVFFEFLRRIGYCEAVRQHLPFSLTSPNAIDPVKTFTAFLLSVVAGARRFAHTSWLRADKALHALLGIARFPVDDTVRNLFKRFGQGQCQRFFSGLWSWQLARLPECSSGYSLDLDSTVFERYGHQQGALRGPNPRKHGRPSHHPLVAVLAEAHFLLHGWLRSGNCGTARGVVEFLKEALALLPEKHTLRVVRADAGFFDQQLLGFLEQRGLPYIVVARLTPWLKREAARLTEWRALDPHYSVGEFSLQLLGWDRARRFVVIREQLRTERASLGRKLLEVPGYTFRLFVTNLALPGEEIWRDYNRRSDMENRIAELKHDLAADDFCLQEFFATEAAFRSILLLFNLLGEFQRATGLATYRQPATLRAQVFLCGALLGRAGHRLVLHLSTSWGGLQQRIPLLEKLLAYEVLTSPKLHSQPIT
ncbi:MAG TPA: IS1380 family transposase [Candidatus Acidoferrales bacterium]|nr:IS1380 family transposase [Candidatus Acidoferrales bacterium]